MAEDSDHPSTVALQEVLQHVESKLLPAIAAADSSPNSGLDFLHAKNTLLTSYLIDLVVHLRDNNNGAASSQNQLRLLEMKTVLQKLPNSLDKKLRYQIDKLLSSAMTSQDYVTHHNQQEDPLQYRPDPDALLEENDSGDDDSSDDDDEDASKGEEDGSDQEDYTSDGDEDDDADLAAARQAIAMSTKKKSNKKHDGNNDENQQDKVYRAPRLTAVPYTHDKEALQAQREKRQRKRLRASELAQTLKAQYGDKPDEEDAMSDLYGKQRAAVRKLAQLEKERTEYEEANLIRLQASSKEKKEKKRIQRMMMESGGGNFAQMANLDNLVRETQAFGRNDNDQDDYEEDAARNQALQDFYSNGGRTVKQKSSSNNSRHANGKRRRERGGDDSSDFNKKKSGGLPRAQNSLQAALYGSSGSSSSKKKAKRKNGGKR